MRTLLSALALFFALTAMALAANQIKSTEIHITQSDAAVSSATSSSFSLYIGDNLSGVSTPMKSAHIAISGVYTGNGTLAAQLNSNAATAQTFTLPNVGSAPTPFEILYKDPTNTINPQSAGTYTYTLNLNPSGITIYGLGVKAVETHRYKPPSCAAGYPATGTLMSSTFDTSIANGAAYNWLMWQGTLPASTVVGLQLATSNCANGDTNPPSCNNGVGWQYYGDTNGDGTCGASEYYEPIAGTSAEIVCRATHNDQRYFRYKARLCSAADCASGGANTPTVDDIVVNWSP